jgi:hypothetical protein
MLFSVSATACLTAAQATAGGVGALELTADGVGNGVLGSQHRR